MHRILFDELTIVINGRNSLAPCRIHQDRHNFTAFFCSLLLSVDWLKHTQRQRRLVACRLVGLLSSRNTFHVRRALLALVIEFVGCAKYPIHKEFALFKWNSYQFTLSNGWYGMDETQDGALKRMRNAKKVFNSYELHRCERLGVCECDERLCFFLAYQPSWMHVTSGRM